MTKKGRPKKVRYIQHMPVVRQFSPRGKPGRPDEVELSLDQFEAIKLADFQGYDQTQGAAAMRMSRPNFGRILREGRRLVSDAIVNGKIIRIGMGDAQIGVLKQDLTERFSPKLKDEATRQLKALTKELRQKSSEQRLAVSK